MTAPRIVIAEFMDEAAVDALGQNHEVLYDPLLVDDRAALVAATVGSKALIVRNRTRVDAQLLDAGPALVVVGRLGVGLDNIDLEACAARNVEVIPATGANSDAVAEYVIASVLVLMRGAFMASPVMVAGSWPRTDLVGREVGGRTMGLVGFGDIARRVARRANALGMNVIAYDPFLDPGDRAWNGVESVDMDDLLRRSDALSIHVPLTEETAHLIGSDALSSMPSGAVLINTSRGGIVDEQSVVDSLRNGHLGGAALDVFQEEPMTADSGALFRDTPNLILTPHIAGVTVESNHRVSALIADRVTDKLAEIR
ncbi:MAG: hydroxyacid dehydrogenase [Acidimicrobiia bacterium]